MGFRSIAEGEMVDRRPYRDPLVSWPAIAFKQLAAASSRTWAWCCRVTSLAGRQTSRIDEDGVLQQELQRRRRKRMRNREIRQRAAGVPVVVALLATAVHGQGRMASEVTGYTGGVGPGVTVEVGRPALIEGERVAVADSQGRYSFVDRRFGTDEDAFSLAALASVARDGLELPASLARTIDVKLHVGAVVETNTVSGGTPMTSTAQPGAEAGSGVALLAFVNISGTAVDDWYGAGIAETLAVSLEEAGVPVVRVDVADAAGEAEAHGPRSARWFVTGSYQRQGTEMRITARVVDVATGEVVQTSIVDGLATELFSLQDRLVADLRPRLSTTAGRARTPDNDGPPRFAVVERPAESSVAEAAGQSGPAPVAEHPARPTGDDVRAARPAGSDSRTAPGTRADGPPPEPGATIRRDAMGRATLRAVRVPDPLRIDGVLDEAVYETIPPFGGFLQQLPVEGAPSTERTDAWVFYDGENVYVAARLWDSAPESRWIANEMRRDSFQLIQNDYFSAAFDTFHDGRNGVGFMINPLGGFLDFEITDEGNPNLDWNPVWDSSVGRFNGGWAVEMAIPFKSIRFRPGAEQQWGLQLGRSIRWKNETAYLNPVPISGGPESSGYRPPPR